LNTAHSHGLRAMWTGSLDDATVNSIRNNPALYAYYITDEPSASQFAGLASTVSHLHTLDPNHVAYINLFPNYADPTTQLGTPGYSEPYIEYLNRYISTVKPSLLSYDNYQFFTNRDGPDYFKNLAMISYKAKQANIPFVNIVQAASWDPSVRVPNGNELRYLYYTSLAYGAQGVSDYVYYAAGHTGGMALANGTTTSLYTAASTINPQFVAIRKQIQSLYQIGAYHLGDLPWGFATSDGSSPMRLPGNSPFQLSPAISNTNYVVNQPVKGVLLGLWGADAQMADATRTLVVNLNYSSSLTTTVNGPANLSVFDPATGTWTPTGHHWATLTLLPGGGSLVGLTSVVPEPSTIVLLGTGAGALAALALRRRRGCC
jgi:hypothetical protein